MVLPRPGATVAYTGPETGPVEYRIKLVYIQPAGETFTEDEKAEVLRNTQAALDWWTALSPHTSSLSIDPVAETRLTSTTVYTDPFSLYSVKPGEILLFTIDTSTSNRTLCYTYRKTCNIYSGLGWPNGGPVVVGFTNRGTTPQVIAHEMGHAVYGLLDVYLLPRQQVRTIDIMDSSFFTAFAQRFIGCYSLNLLRAPCKSTYLPTIQR